MKNIETVREIVKKIIVTLHHSTKWHGASMLGVSGSDISVKNLTNMSFNHAFDDNPDYYGLEKQEAHILRAYLHNTMQGDYGQSLAKWAKDF